MRKLFLQHLAQTSPSPLAIEVARAEGSYFYSPDGKAYLDLIAGISVSNLGHQHPAIVKAIQAQAAQHLHILVYGELVLSPQVQYATRLAELLPAPLSQVYFTNSGAEATEGAMKLAKRYTHRTEIIACHRAYHGSTQGALSIGGTEDFKQAFRPLLPDTRLIHYGSFSDLRHITERTAAVVIEIVQAEAGVIAACTPYFQALRQRCTEVGALLIVDECQTGLGRTGSMWAHTAHGIVPDVITLAKALGGGLPLGAFVSSPDIMKSLTHAPVLGHITTFGGHPLSCAAGLAALEATLTEQLIEQVPHKAALFREHLLPHAGIHALRQAGLMMAIELGSFERVLQVMHVLLDLGVMTDWFLYCNTALRVAPPLNISEAEIQQACQAIRQALEA